ncbi:MAG TPA: hypothetical protein VIL72_03985, partial [Beijerinckiaceae bacterium]
MCGLRRGVLAPRIVIARAVAGRQYRREAQTSSREEDMSTFRSAALAAAFGAILCGACVDGAKAAEPLKIGVILPSSGVFAPIGKEQLNGMQIAVEEAGGAVAGRPI